MRRRNKLILIVLFLGLIIFMLMRYSNMWLYINGGSMINSDNITVKQLIVNAINVQYKGGDKKQLEKIFTSEFITKISNDEFYKKGRFYLLDKGFMDNFQEINENEASISVGVQDIHGHYIQIITLMKNENGRYYVSRIQNDI